MTTRRATAAFLPVLLLLAWTPASAQDAPAKSGAPTLSDVASLTHDLSKALLAAASRRAPDPAVAEIAVKVEEFTQARADREERLDRVLQRRAPVHVLRVLREESFAARKDLEEWEGTLDARFAARSQALERLRTAGEALEDARRRGRDLPPALADQADSLRTSAAELERALTARLDEVVSARGKVVRARAATDANLERIDAALERNAAELFRRDAPPLWRPWSEMQQGRPGGPPFRDDLREVYRYASTRYERLLAHALLVVVLAATLAALQRGARRREQADPGVREAADALGHPFRAALVLGLLPSYWIHPFGPRGLVLAVYAAVSLPLLGLLHAHLAPPLRAATRWLVAALLVLFVVEVGTVEFGPAYRIGLLVAAFACATAFATAQSPRRLTALPAGRSRALIAFAVRFGIATLAAAALADVLGWVRLADSLVRSAISITYFGLLTIVGALVLRAFVDLSLRSRSLQSLRIVRNRADLISRRLKGLVNVAGVLFWGFVTLLVTRLLWPVRTIGEHVLSRPLSLGDLQITLGDLVAFGLTFWIALLASRLVRFTLEEGVLPAVSLPRGMPATVSKLSGYAIVTVGFLLALGAGGFPLDRLTFMAGAFGLGVGFGLQNVIANFVSGLILLVERPIQVGDTIEFGARTGRVTRIGMRSSIVRTFDGAEINVPNGNLVSNELVNWTMSDALRRLVISVGVSYGTDPKTIPDILLPAAREHEGIKQEPPPEVLFLGFGESSLNFELRCWTTSPDWIRYRSEITFAIHERLRQAGVEIPFPQRDLHLRSSDVALRPDSGS